jgi:hypothetical protein
MRVALALIAVLAVTACSDDGDAELGFDLGILREHALAAGQRVDKAEVAVSSERLVGDVFEPVDTHTLHFELSVPSGIPLLLEAKTCIEAAGACVPNYWGFARATPAPRSRSELVIKAYGAGELLIDVKRVDGGPIPDGFRVDLDAVAPRDPQLAHFSAQQGARIVLPAGAYRVATSALNDGALSLALVNDPMLTVGQGASLSQTLVFGACTAGVDFDKDGVDCLVDCDDTSPSCAVDCGTDVDTDGTPDCRDGCLDADRDGYGRAGQAASSCLGADCDDSNASRAPDRAEVCNGYDDDCDPGTIDNDACVATDGGSDPDGFDDEEGFTPADDDFEPAPGGDDCGSFGDDMSGCILE